MRPLCPAPVYTSGQALDHLLVAPDDGGEPPPPPDDILYALHTAREVIPPLPMGSATTMPVRSSHIVPVSAYLLCRQTHIKLMFEPREDQTLRTLSSLASSGPV